MPRKKGPPNPEIQEILKSHVQRVFNWCLVPFTMGAVLLVFEKHAGWVASIGSLFFWAHEAFAARFRESMTLHKLREDIQYTNGLSRGFGLGFSLMLGSNLARLLSMDQAIWVFVVFSIISIICLYLQEQLMRQTAALLDEPTG